MIEIVKFRWKRSRGKKEVSPRFHHRERDFNGSWEFSRDSRLVGERGGGGGPLVFNVNSQIGEGQGNQLTANE